MGVDDPLIGDDADRRHRLGDRLADMGEPHRAAGQEHGVDIVCGQSRLRETDLDAGRDALGQLPCMVDEIGAADGGVQAGRDPFQRDVGLPRVGQRNLGFLDLHRQRVAALFIDHTHQPIEQVGLTCLAPNLADIRHHARFVHAVDAGPGREVVEIARRHLEPGALHGTQVIGDHIAKTGALAAQPRGLVDQQGAEHGFELRIRRPGIPLT